MWMVMMTWLVQWGFSSQRSLMFVKSLLQKTLVFSIKCANCKGLHITKEKPVRWFKTVSYILSLYSVPLLKRDVPVSVADLSGVWGVQTPPWDWAAPLGRVLAPPWDSSQPLENEATNNLLTFNHIFFEHVFILHTYSINWFIYNLLLG